MNDPLKIMDEIEQISLDRINHEAELVVTRKQWQSLRTAIEAVKVEALREYAEHKREQAIEAGQGARRDRCNRMASNAEAYADRIEQEAKEES